MSPAKTAPPPRSARERWEACRKLGALLAKAEPSWSPAENFYYPLRSEPLSPRDIAREWGAALSRRAPGGREMTSLYVHIPFCRAKCAYCVYFSKGGPDPAEVKAFLKRLASEIEFYAPAFSGTRFDAWSIGGGTPTLLDAPDLDRLLTRLRRAFPPKERPSLEFETSPVTATAERLDVFRSHGFNRVSFGVQSFSSGVLRRVDRGYQEPAHVRRCMKLLQDRGFRINMDLLYGLPGGGQAETLSSAASAMRLGPDSVVIYPLSAGTPAMPGQGSRGSLPPFEKLSARLAPLAARMGYAVESDWFSVRLHSRKLVRPQEAPPAYDDLHAGPLFMMCLGPSSRGHIDGRLAYRHDAFAPGSAFRPEEAVAAGWKLTPEDETRMRLTRTLSRSGRVDATGEKDLDALARLGVLKREGKGFVRRAPKSRAGHAAELFLLGGEVRSRLEERVRGLGAADIVNRGIRLCAAGRRARAGRLFGEAAKLDPGGLGGAVSKAVRASASFQSLWNAVEVHGADRRVDLAPLLRVLTRVREALNEGVKLYASGKRSAGLRLFRTAASLDPGGAGTALLEAVGRSPSLGALAEAARALGTERLADLGPIEAVLAKIHLLNEEGVRRFKAGEHGRAARCFEAALRLDPHDHNALMSLGALASSGDRPAEALALYDRVSPSQLKEGALADWAGARALVLAKLGRKGEAVRQVNAALASKDIPEDKRASLSAYLRSL